MQKINKIFLLTLLSVFTSSYTHDEPKWIDVVFSRRTLIPYETIITIPARHKPYYQLRTNLSVNWFVYEDSSYIYWTQMGVSPNRKRMCAVMDSLSFEQRFNHYFFYNFNPRGDTLWPVSCEGVDIDGRCWKDVHYIFPDSLCYVKRRGEIVNIGKSKAFRITVGYARVPLERKHVFDKALASFRIQRKDTSMPADEQYHTEKKERSGFKYLGDTTGIFVEAPEMDLLWEMNEQ